MDNGSHKKRSGNMSMHEKFQYEFQGFAGVDNCFLCDVLTHVDEYERSDGRVIVICKRCQFPYMPDTRKSSLLVTDECQGCGRVTQVYDDTLMCRDCSKGVPNA